MSDEPIFELELECAGCPEIWNFYHEGEYVGYTRLRHGVFYCFSDNDLAKCTVYTADIADDMLHGSEGIFVDRVARDLYLGEAAKHLVGHMGIPTDDRTLYTREDNVSYE